MSIPASILKERQRHCPRPQRGVAAGSIVKREPGYYAPVCHHFGLNELPGKAERPRDLIGGCTFCRPEKIVYIDELDPEDNVNRRLAEVEERCSANEIKPEVEWAGDGYITCTLFIPEKEDVAEFAALEIAAKMGLQEAEVIHKRVIHPAEGTLVELKGIVPFSIDRTALRIPEKPQILTEEEIREEVAKRPLKVVCVLSVRMNTPWACARSSISSTAGSRGLGSRLSTWALRFLWRKCSMQPLKRMLTPS